MHDQHFVRDADRDADLPHDGEEEGVEVGVRPGGVGRLDALTGAKFHDGAWPHGDLVRGQRLVGRDAGGDDVALAALALDEHREERRDDGGHEFGLGVAVELLQVFDDRGQQRHAARQADPVAVEQVQHQRSAGLAACRDACPLVGHIGLCQRAVAGVVVLQVVGDGLAVPVDLDAVADVLGDVSAQRIADAVGLDQLDAQRQEGRALLVATQGEHVAVVEGRQEGESLKLVEVLRARDVAHLGLGPQIEEDLDLVFPLLGGVVGQTEELALKFSLQLQAGADDIDLRGVARAARYRRVAGQVACARAQ